MNNDSAKYSKNKNPENVEFSTDKNQSKVYLILDFSAVNYVDTNGVKMIQQLIQDLKKNNVFIFICQAQGDFKLLERIKFIILP